MVPRKTYFLDEWLEDPEFVGIISSVPSDKSSFRCLLCKKNFNLSNMGRQAVVSHIKKSKSHTSKLKSVQTVDKKVLGSFLNKPTDKPKAAEAVPTTSTSCTEKNTDKVTITAFFKDDVSVLRAEILWVLHLIDIHGSINSVNKSVPLFQSMFPDSEIAKSMHLGSTKASYLYNFGFAEYLKTIFCYF